jgi:Putative adhesin
VQTTTQFVSAVPFVGPLARCGGRLLIVSAAILFVSLPSFATTEQVFEKTYPLMSGGQFVLDNVNGSVQVDGWDREEVEVTAVKTAQNDPRDVDRVQIEVQSQPHEVDVHTRYPDGEGAGVAVEYHIHVPNRVLLGSVHTVNGSLIVRGVDGGGELRSVNGDVEVLQSSGRFNAKTTNGNLLLELRELGDGAPMNLETVNGSVELGLPSDARADLNISNMNGDMYSEVPVTSAAALPGARAFHGTLGHGGGAISLRTVNGGIRLVLEHPGA